MNYIEELNISTLSEKITRFSTVHTRIIKKVFLCKNPVKNEFKTIPSIEKADKSKLKNYIPHTRKSITT